LSSRGLYDRPPKSNCVGSTAVSVGERVPNRVLVADDDRAIRESLARALELEGYDVATVAAGWRR
jgi:PleD family two-component response regulator